MFVNNVVGGAGNVTGAESVDFKDNLYLAVNGDWQRKAVIPKDYPRVGTFPNLFFDVEKKLRADFNNFVSGDESIQNKIIAQAVKLYKMALETKGSTDIKTDLQKMISMNNLTDLNNGLKYFFENDFVLPLIIDVHEDMKDNSQKAFYVGGARLFLPDKSYYDAGNESGERLLKLYAKSANELLTKLGYDSDFISKTIKEAFEFDQSLVPVVKSSEEWADYPKIYNPISFAEFGEKSDYLDLQTMTQELVTDSPKQIIVGEPRYFEHFNELVNDDTFENVKSWMIVSFLMKNAELIDENCRQIVSQYKNALMGINELEKREKYAYHLTISLFSEPIGIFYGKKYFGGNAKKDVNSMVRKIINTYKKRLTSNNWLSEATKQHAILKLDKMEIKIGYPEKVDPLYSEFTINTDKSLYENVRHLKSLIAQDMFKQYHKPFDRSKWNMPGYEVNASYGSSANDITFPAAVLQKPFYSLDQTASQNYGGIGSVIAHEISHSFDNNGARFDESGNMNNWWTKQDYDNFQTLTQKMIDQFEGIPYLDQKINGTLVVSENIADVGGLACTLEVAKAEKDFDGKKFFINWALNWRIKSTKQIDEMLLSVDVHSPAPLRCNVIAQDMNDLYEVFDIKETDGMWLDPDKRVNIW
ncbi:M13 family metallopeptidase [Companilactobacillus sp. HBUAS56275]|uniref:M13 family metallopeptidase n=1 Tax=Companilactobacillus sp. HBUAS56275 TaxID=3109364 RepID=UPI002FEECA6D